MELELWLDNYYFPGIASSGCAKTADDANSLLDIFNKISETITNNLEITGAKIVDAIDPKFIILDDKGVQITEKYLTSKNIESVTLANGEKYITKKEYSTSNGQIRQFRIRIIMLSGTKP